MGETAFLQPGHAFREPPNLGNVPSPEEPATAACSNRLEITGLTETGKGEEMGRADTVWALARGAGGLGDLWITIRSLGAHWGRYQHVFRRLL